MCVGCVGVVVYYRLFRDTIGSCNKACMRIIRMVQGWFAPSQTSLVSPFLDSMLVGGVSIIAYIILQVAVSKGADIFTWSIALYYAAFLINFPHFAASYLLMYGDARQSFGSLRTGRRFMIKMWWAGLAVPVLLIGYFLYAKSQGSIMLMGYLVNALFFFVGWHYIKQIFGCVVVLSATKKVYYNRLERTAILLPLYLLWALSFFSANISGAHNMFYQVPYTAWTLPPLWLKLSEQVLFVASNLLLAMFIVKYIISRVTPPVSAVIALVSIYLWYIPALSHPYFFYIIPLFHSLQYLLFVFAARRNQAIREERDTPVTRNTASRYNLWGGAFLLLLPAVLIGLSLKESATLTLDRYIMTLSSGFTTVGWVTGALLCLSVGMLTLLYHRQARGRWGIVTFFGSAYFLGALFFALIPIWLDLWVARGTAPAWLSYPTTVFGTSLYFFFFTVFLNIHHYFIDNVIWKKDNPYVAENLMYRPVVAESKL